ncbi:neuroligin-4, X-linked-like [Athalia rosae]|uniref:neuroligin-4, X-linked-like n=1 Tax=Athalia rosae TaxID=37344 RepID=UPI00062553CA|nr:neuroligin-4, X-linked-like [Athalia rosae]XP_020708184.1 neuroligin-4, X-linked-like [Athalia rosae]XP_020708185.1 neuroligin-4, X-linked-like [Athalia rosae]XP_048509353.1 neuroligin-4, X-linked-like [Athalia rosae]XP_048509354.1 neuroligin-4, X-linked-like [Athalia rosae]XP_048509355.1 neuroligin-4, X-linked-like [Athalia rosae]
MPLRCQLVARVLLASLLKASLLNFFNNIVILTVIISYSDSSNSQSVTRYASRIVETKSGQIRGIRQELNGRHLDPVEVFRGIPYAAPPVQELRFRSPQPPLSWTGVKLADTFGSVCPQNYPDVSNRTIALAAMPQGRFFQLKRLLPFLANQSEDCLFLNLYIPGSGSRGLEAPYAVIVYVHGESFEWGSGNPYDGSVLASAGHVIVVTLNYRLGILGFLRTRPGPDTTDGSGGNLALKDIAMGLQWVRDNIAAFGGDPNRITLIGHDTGAALANLLLLAPYGKGLLHRLVLLSGSALSPWAAVHEPDDLRQKIAEHFECPLDTGSDVADCLREIPLQTLMELSLPETRFMPSIGPGLPVDINSPDPSHDMERDSGTFVTIPLIVGVTTAESYLDFNANDIQYGFEEEQRNRVLRTFVRNAYVYHLNEIFSAIRNEYTDWDKPVLHPINIRDSTMEALSDGHTVAPLMRVAFYHARRGAKTFFYHFNYQTKDSEYLQRLGSVRGEDIPYVFGLPLVSGGTFFPQNYSRQDQGVAEAVLTFFANFAKTGNPNEPRNVDSVDYGTVKEKTRFRGLMWEQYETGSQQYLTIALKPKMKSHYRGHKMAVWLNLIPQLHQPGDDDVTMRHHHFKERGDHLYAGPVREEWQTPMLLPGNTVTTSLSTTECTTAMGEESTSEVESVASNIVDGTSERHDDTELLQRLASRHYYSTTTALAITVGVGCILLILNMLIFAGIYYQRDREKKRAASECTPNGHQDSLPMSVRPTSRDSNEDTRSEEPPPSYTTLARASPPPPSSTMPEQRLFRDETSFSRSPGIGVGKEQGANPHKDPIPPKPPTRTTSSLTTTSVKKRVQIQEISV